MSLIRTIECAVLFGGIPGLLIVAQVWGGFPFFPVLLVLMGVTLFLGWRDPDIQLLGQGRNVRAGLKGLMWRVPAVAVFLVILTWAIAPELLFRFPRTQPRLWALVMILYPLLSVLPQEILFRTFFMQRYRTLFGDGLLMLIVNAFAFAWAHAFFLNWIAPLLSLGGGILLAQTYRTHRSLRLVCLEHALYGQLVFTVGIGWYFYTGSIQATQALTGP